MAEITGLSVQVSAETGEFRVGMENAEGAAQDLSLSLRRLGMASESAERDLDSAGRSATTTAGAFGGLSVAAEGAGFSVHGLSASILVSLVPALVTLTAALTPVVAALGGLATIGAAIGGIGLVATIGAIATNTEMLKSEFTDMVGVLKSEFAPVFDLAAGALQILLGEFEQIIPQLVPAEGIVSRLAADFLNLGRAFIDVLPALAELAITLTEEFLPPFVEFVESILPQAPDMLRSLVSVARDVLPMFMDFGDAVLNLLGPLNEFGMTALPIIADALGWLNGFLIDTLQFVNGLENAFTDLVAGGSLVLPFLVALVSYLGGPVTAVLGSVVAGAIGLAQAFRTNFANIRDYAQGLWTEFQQVFDALKIAFDEFISGVEFGQIMNAVSDFENVLGNQLMQTLEELKPVFDDFKAFLFDNREEFRLLGETAGDFLTSLINIASTIVSVVYPAVRSVLIPALETMIKVADLGLSIIGDMVRLFQEVRAGDFQGAISVMQESESPAALADLVTPGENITQQRLEGAIQNQIEVIIEGELPEESIKSVKANEIENTNRRTRRNQGRTANPN